MGRRGCTSRCPTPAGPAPARPSGSASQCHQTESPERTSGMPAEARSSSEWKRSVAGEGSFCRRSRRTCHPRRRRRAAVEHEVGHRLRDRRRRAARPGRGPCRTGPSNPGRCGRPSTSWNRGTADRRCGERRPRAKVLLDGAVPEVTEGAGSRPSSTDRGCPGRGGGPARVGARQAATDPVRVERASRLGSNHWTPSDSLRQNGSGGTGRLPSRRTDARSIWGPDRRIG